MIKKLCSILLVICMVLCLAPEAAFGASKITKKDGSTLDKVYVGSKYILAVKDQRVKFYSDDNKIATITKLGRMKPLAAGKVKITARSVRTGKMVATKTVTVLKRSKKVTTDAKEIYMNAGDTQTIKAKLTPSDSSDVIRFSSSDKQVAAIDATTGTITAKTKGEATVTVYAKATAATSNSSKNTRTTEVKVHVGPSMKEAEQHSLTEIQLTFRTNMENYKLKPSDFSIINTTTQAKATVRGVSVSGKTVTLTTYGEIRDGQVYRVSYDKTSAEFTATEGEVKAIRIEPTEIQVKTATEIKVLLLDKDGIILGSYNKNNKPAYVDFNLRTAEGYVSGGKLYLNTLKAKGVANAVYHTYRYEGGTEVDALYTGDVTITAVEKEEKDEEKKEENETPSYIPSYSPYQIQYTVGEELPIMVKDDVQEPESGQETNEEADNDAQKPKPVVKRMEGADFEAPIKYIYFNPEAEENTTSANIYFNIKKYGKEANYGDYTVTVAQTDTATIEGADTSDDRKTCSMQEGGIITLTPKKAGTAILVIREGDTYVTTVPLIISNEASILTKILPVTYDENGDAQITNEIEVDNYPTYSYNEGETETEDKSKMQADIYFILKDQYGRILSKGTNYTEVTLNRSESFISQINGSELIRFSGEGLEPGTKTYEVLLQYNYPKSETETQNKNLVRKITMQVNPPTVTLEAKQNYQPSENDNLSARSFVEEAYTLRLNGKEILSYNAANIKYGGSSSIPEYYIIGQDCSADRNKATYISYKIYYNNCKLEIPQIVFDESNIPTIPPQTENGDSTQENNDMPDAA